MKRYSEYKESGAEWLPEIPDKWETSHVKRVCQNVTDGAHTSPDLSSPDKPFVTVVNIKNGKIDLKDCLYTSQRDYDQLVRNGCKPQNGDVLYSKDGTIAETIVVNETASFVVGSSLIILKSNRLVIPQYLKLILASYSLKNEAFKVLRGAGLPRISIGNVAKLQILKPPPEDQKSIANYLEKETGKIDQKIAGLEKKTLLYKELKQSIINETVTRGLPAKEAQAEGLTPNPSLKNSGIPWIGEIPEHWEVISISAVTDPVSIKNHPNKELLSVYRDYGVIIKSSRDDNHNRAGNLENYKLVKKGWLAMNKMKTWQGSLGVSDYEGIVSPAYIICRVDHKKVTPQYLHFLLRSKRYIGQYNRLSYGVRIDQWDMRYNDFKYLSITIPSEIEQKEISKFIKSKHAHIDKITATITEQITTLKELRKTLINDVVTGKICVTDDKLTK